MFYDLKTLFEAGVKIHLHCFEYGRGKADGLQAYCEEVHYYKRNRSFSWLFRRLPYIITSRKNAHLLKNLSADKFPVLLEGMHCTWYVYKRALAHRKIAVRLHNVEWEYYAQLTRSTRNIFRRVYYLIESLYLKKYEKVIAGKAKLLALSEKDRKTFEDVLGARDVGLLPAFLPFSGIRSVPGKGSFCLYHGNLSVAENEAAALWLLDVVQTGLEIDIVIAGKNPSAYLKKKIFRHPQARLVANADKKQMQDLMRTAHIHLLPSFNVTGTKIKLLNALQNGRFVVTNRAAVAGTGLTDLCIVYDDAEDFRVIVRKLLEQTFSNNERDLREKLLAVRFNNAENVRILVEWMNA